MDDQDGFSPWGRATVSGRCAFHNTEVLSIEFGPNYRLRGFCPACALRDIKQAGETMVAMDVMQNQDATETEPPPNRKNETAS